MDFGINVDFAVRRGGTHEESFQEAFELVDLAEDFLPFVNPNLSNFHPLCTTGSRRLRVAS